MAQRERKLSKRIMDELRLRGAFCFKVWGNEHMMAGLPDIVGCHHGKFFGLEVKLPENRGGTTPRQLYVRSLVLAAGGHWAVVCSVAEGLRELSLLEKR